jgi:hypothetical protein
MPICPGCRDIYANRTPPEEPPCGDCKIELLQENVDAQAIFGLVRDQYIMGFNGPIGINQLAIHEAMNLYQIKDRQSCFEKVILLSRWWMAKIKKENEG